MRNTKKINIAIIGATGHIAKGLIYNFSKAKKEPSYRLFLFSRSVKKIISFLEKNNLQKCSIYQYKDFKSFTYDVIINCVGIADPAIREKANIDIFETTEKYDNLALRYVINNPDCLYINFSSGAVHSPLLAENNFYRISKLHSETKHRTLSTNHIVDIRVFNYFSRFIDINTKFLITDLIRSVKENREFLTNSSDIIRDYIHPNDLFQCINLIIQKHQNYKNNKDVSRLLYLNKAFDIYSKKPLHKFELINFFKKKYSLTVKIKDSVTVSKKKFYCPNDKKLEQLGYDPQYTSLEAIELEANEMSLINEV